MVGIRGQDLVGTNRLFNITLYQETYHRPVMKGAVETVLPLTQCTPDHLNFNQEMLDFYRRVKISTFLCPPLNS